MNHLSADKIFSIIWRSVGPSSSDLAPKQENELALEPADGRVIFRYPWRPAMQASVTAAVPLVVDDTMFISASYGAGARFLR